MIKEIDLGLTNIEIHEGYIICRSKEGVDISLDHHLEVLARINEYLTPPYAIILDEVNSYSLGFQVIDHIRNDSNILCIGIVYYRSTTKMALSVVTNFIGKPTKYSPSITEVEDWVKDQMTH